MVISELPLLPKLSVTSMGSALEEEEEEEEEV